MKKKGWIGIGIIVLLIVGIVTFFYLRKKGEEEKKISSEISIEKEEKKKEGRVSEMEKEERKEGEEVPKEEEKKEEQKVINPLEGLERTGDYWMMMNFQVTERGEGYEIVGDVYDAKKYSEWTDLVGSLGLEEGENVEEESGLVKKEAIFYLDKGIKLENDGLEGFEYTNQSLEGFLKNPYVTFLFDSKNDLIIKILDWYMNYSG